MIWYEVVRLIGNEGEGRRSGSVGVSKFRRCRLSVNAESVGWVEVYKLVGPLSEQCMSESVVQWAPRRVFRCFEEVRWRRRSGSVSMGGFYGQVLWPSIIRCEGESGLTT